MALWRNLLRFHLELCIRLHQPQVADQTQPLATTQRGKCRHHVGSTFSENNLKGTWGSLPRSAERHPIPRPLHLVRLERSLSLASSGNNQNRHMQRHLSTELLQHLTTWTWKASRHRWELFDPVISGIFTWVLYGFLNTPSGARISPSILSTSAVQGAPFRLVAVLSRCHAATWKRRPPSRATKRSCKVWSSNGRITFPRLAVSINGALDWGKKVWIRAWKLQEKQLTSIFVDNSDVTLKNHPA